MNNDIVQRVSAILTCNGIEHEATEHSVLINRDSICAKISGKDENDSYTQLKEILNVSFDARFNYVAKTDKWLMLAMLNTIGVTV